jgi:23S rRNA pseudouridine1911/1915/1917 synthase
MRQHAVMRAIRVAAGTEPLRVDVFLAQQVPASSRRTAQRAIAAGEVRINGRRARKGDRVRADDLVQVADTLYAPPRLQPNPQLTLRVLYEDEAMIAVDKPAGMPSQPLRRDESRTVANFLLARHPDAAELDPGGREAGLVHRLDVDTSGVLLAARTAAAYRCLRAQFARQQVVKEYVALVDGAVRAGGIVDTPIAHDRRNPRRMRVSAPGDAPGRRAVTHFSPIAHHGRRTLVRVRIPTGVMHQIRVHLASIGYPIVGDRLYGAATTSAPRQLLHAATLSVTHPTSGEAVQIRSPLPADFAEVLRRLRRAKVPVGHG